MFLSIVLNAIEPVAVQDRCRASLNLHIDCEPFRGVLIPIYIDRIGGGALRFRDGQSGGSSFGILEKAEFITVLRPSLDRRYHLTGGSEGLIRECTVHDLAQRDPILRPKNRRRLERVFL